MKVSSYNSRSSVSREQYRQNLLREFKKIATLADIDGRTISNGDMEGAICDSIQDCRERRKRLTWQQIYDQTYNLNSLEQRNDVVKKYGKGFNFGMTEITSFTFDKNYDLIDRRIRYKRQTCDAAEDVIRKIEDKCVVNNISAKRDGFIDEKEFMYYFQHCARLKTAEV